MSPISNSISKLTLALALLSTAAVSAADKFTFIPTTGTPTAATPILWNVPANWTPDPGNTGGTTFPNAVGAQAFIPSNQTTLRNISLGQDITVGTLSIDN